MRWPLVGRSEELASLAYGAAGVVFAGEPGIGRTRLAREILERERTPGTTVCWVAATAAARTRPLGAFAGWVEAHDDPDGLLHRASATLLGRAGPDGLVLGVDDAHHLDDLSAVLVQQLVLRDAVRLVVTVRTGAPVPDAITALWKDGHLRRADLAPLPPEDTARLLDAGLGGRVDPASAHRLWAVTCGNPLYLRRLVEDERASGRLAVVDGAWRWSGTLRLAPGLAALVTGRIGQLTDDERELLDLLAFGGPLTVALLSSLVDPGTLERAEERGLLVVDAGAGARLSHPLFGEARRAGCGPARARRIRARLAAALADDEHPGHLVRRAALAVETGLPVDAGFLVEAARRALEVSDTELAARLASAAITAGGDGFEARFTLARCACLRGRGDDGERMLAELAATTDDQVVRLAVARITTRLLVTDRAGQALTELTRAKATLPAGRRLDGLRAALEAQLAAAPVGRPPDLLAARVLATETASHEDVVLATWGLVTARGGCGDLAGLAEAVARSDGLSGPGDLEIVRLGSIAEAWTRALRLAGRLADAERFVAERRRLLEGRDGLLPAVVDGLAAALDLDRGRVAPARRRFEEARAATVLPGWAAVHAVGRAVAAGMAGDAEAASAAAAQAAAASPAGHAVEPEVQLARAWAAAAAGSVGVARGRAREAARIAAVRQPAVEVVALHTAVQFGDRTVARRLAELAARVDGVRAPAAAAHAEAWAAGDGDGLLAAADRLDDLGAALLAADAAAQAVTVFDGQGRHAEAQAAARRMAQLAERCPGASTPARRGADLALPLSEREREVVELVAAGRSNRDAATMLGISVRTVEGHVYRACTKLDVHDRAGLVAIAAR